MNRLLSKATALCFGVGGLFLAGCGGNSNVVSSTNDGTLASGFARLRIVNGAENFFYGFPCNSGPSFRYLVDGASFGQLQMPGGTGVVGAATDYYPVLASQHSITIQCSGSNQVGNVLRTPLLTAGQDYTLVLAGSNLAFQGTGANGQGQAAAGTLSSSGTGQVEFFADPQVTGPSIRFYHVSPSAPTSIDFGSYAANGASLKLGTATFVAGTAIPPAVFEPSTVAPGIPLPGQPVPELTPNAIGEVVVLAPAVAAASPGLTIYAGFGTAPFVAAAASPSPIASPSPSPLPGVVAPTPLPFPSPSPAAIAQPAAGAPYAIGAAYPQDTLNLLPFGQQRVISIFVIDPFAGGQGVSLPSGYPQLFGVFQ